MPLLKKHDLRAQIILYSFIFVNNKKFKSYNGQGQFFFVQKILINKKKVFHCFTVPSTKLPERALSVYEGMINIYFEQIVFEFWGQNTIGIIKTVIGTNILKNHRYSLKGGTTVYL